MVLAVSRRFITNGPKIASDKLPFLYGRLTLIYGQYGQLLNVIKKRFALWALVKLARL